MTKQEFFARFTKRSSVKVQDSSSFEWVRPHQAYSIKTLYCADTMAQYTPVKF